MFRNKKGFTLIELMVVIVIIGILAALAIPRFTEASNKAKAAEAPRILASYESAQLACLAERGVLGSASDLIFTSPDSLDSKWWSYSFGAAAGNYRGAVKAGVTIGDIKSGDGIQTTVATSGTITHATFGNATTDALKKYIPNFMSN